MTKLRDDDVEALFDATNYSGADDENFVKVLERLHRRLARPTQGGR